MGAVLSAGRLLGLAACGLLLIGCEAQIEDGRLLCDTADSDTCPGGYVCCPAAPSGAYDGLCFRDACGDAGASIDGGLDSGVADAGPVDAGPPPAILEVVAGGQHTCARLSDDSVWCWGDNESGQLGNGENTTTPRTSPVAVVGLPTGAVTQIALARATTCAVVAEALYCWGSNSTFGQPGALGAPSVAMLSASPVEVLSPAERVAAVALGSDHGCAIVGADRHVVCWGVNGGGQLGVGDRAARDRPTGIPGLTGVSAIDADESHTCAIVSDRTARCWGANDEGQLGNGASGFGVRETSPVEVSSLADLIAIDCGSRHTCAVRPASGGGTEVLCWGKGDSGELGGTSESSPVTSARLVEGTSLTMLGTLSAGGREAAFFGGFTCATSSGAALCWGHDLQGQLGNGASSFADQPVPSPVSGLDAEVTLLTTGWAHACALRGATLWCWGRNDRGQLGDGTTADQAAPVRVGPFE